MCRGAILSPGNPAVNAPVACSYGLYVLLEKSEEKKQIRSKKMVALRKCYKEYRALF